MAVQSIQLNVTTRSERGTRANRRLRDAGMLPGVIYGHKEEVIPVTLNKREVVTHLARGAHVFDLNYEGKTQKVLVKDVQYDHLNTGVIHVDFARVSLDERVQVSVPIELKGEPKGIADGGMLQQVIASLSVECLVTEIPEVVRHNVAELVLNDVVKIKDLKLPDGVKCLQDSELIVATVREVKEEIIEVVAAETTEAEPEIIGRKPAEGEEAAVEGAAPAQEKEKK